MNTKSLDRNHAQQGKFVFECNYTVQVAAPRGTKLINIYNGEESTHQVMVCGVGIIFREGDIDS